VPEGSEGAKDWHPRCCEVPMWLVEVQKAGPQSHYVFECKVCDARVMESQGIVGQAPSVIRARRLSAIHRLRS